MRCHVAASRTPAGRTLARAAMLAVLAAGVTPAAPQAATTAPLVRGFAGSAHITAYGGVVAWSARTPSGDWALMVRRGGRVMRAPLRTRAVPFDIDLGPDAHGRTTAVFSRCAVEPSAGLSGQFDPTLNWSSGRRCRIRAWVVGDAREHPLAGLRPGTASDTTPAIWRDRLVFARTRPRRDPEIRLRRGARFVPLRQPAPGVMADAVVHGIDLSATTIGFLRRFNGDGWQLRAYRLSPGLSGPLLLATGSLSGTCGYSVLSTPSVVARTVYAVRWAAGCVGGERASFLAAATWPVDVVAARPPAPPIAMARDGRVTYWLRDRNLGTASHFASGCDIGGAGCDLVATTGLGFSRIG